LLISGAAGGLFNGGYRIEDIKVGELFRRDRPKNALAWTGERLVTGIDGAIENEHLHRYFLARELCRGKDVLDVASGEGYGATLLAQTAERVTGVELDSASVEHSSREYERANLRFIQGTATDLPLDAESVDIVVSFETIEHLSDQGAFLAEVKRVLRPDGFVIISTPDVNVYSALGTAPNPFHMKELTEAEFCAELKTTFRNVSILRQRAIVGSAILPDVAESRTGETRVYEQRDSDTFESHRQLPRAPYLLAVASNSAMPTIDGSLYIQTVKLTEPISEVKAELDRLRSVEAAAREQAPIFAKAMADVESTQKEASGLTAAMKAMEVELERLRSVEAAAREQADVMTIERHESRVELETIRRQLDISVRRGQQQVLAVQHLHQDFRKIREEKDRTAQELWEVEEEKDRTAQELREIKEEKDRTAQELREVKEEKDRYILAYNEACALIIPLRIRRSLPEFLKRPLRALKRVMRSALLGAQ
jgi:2-polyprenyl-3-methyl-5-hydroxy-6-metoxy-1,4-benzoquinol methylase/predicted  nucleic acid-binding Zn-ribbon protein